MAENAKPKAVAAAPQKPDPRDAKLAELEARIVELESQIAERDRAMTRLAMR
jgi:hypothetical protein